MGRKTVFIGVVKRPGDLAAALRERWYRVPAEKAPRGGFTHIAFYQPSSFGAEGGKIRFYAKTLSCSKARRLDLLPDQPEHPCATREYVRYALSAPVELPRPIRNGGCERVSCGYTTMRLLRSAKDIHGLFGARPLEKILRSALRLAGLRAVPEYTVRAGRRRYRLDFAAFGACGKLDIECDGVWHARRAVRERDAERDSRLAARGWTILRLSEAGITGNMSRVIAKIRLAIKRIGGERRPEGQG